MAVKIVEQAISHRPTLWNQRHLFWKILSNFFYQERVMRAAQYHCIYARVAVEKAVDMLFYKVISTCFVELPVFNEGNPHGTRFAGDSKAGMEFPNLHLVGT